MSSSKKEKAAAASSSKVTIPEELVQLAIKKVLKKHYLGSSNHETGDPTGGLSGYYLNVCRRLSPGEKTPINEVFLQATFVEHRGVGNCGELALAFYSELLLMDLTPEQKKTIQLWAYETKDAHQLNSYVVIGDQVYDLWSNKFYPKTKLRSETKVKEKDHIMSCSPEILELHATLTKDKLKSIKDGIQSVCVEVLNQQLDEDRATHFMYVTLDETDPSDNALFATMAFPFLFSKFIDTINDVYFETSLRERVLIQRNIIRDYVFLLEEMRADYALHYHPNRRRYSDDEIKTAMRSRRLEEHFINFILAMSYQNVAPSRTNEELSALREILLGTDSDLARTLIRHITLVLRNLASKTTACVAGGGEGSASIACGAGGGEGSATTASGAGGGEASATTASGACGGEVPASTHSFPDAETGASLSRFGIFVVPDQSGPMGSGRDGFSPGGYILEPFK